MLYFIPAIMAFNDKHPNRVAILLFNLFLGWTLLGWIVVMIWVATASRRNAR
jgi:threonine/homoserine/homoserine lactone efflux protein